ncbi:MAG: hypothetical protein DF221_10085 [Brevibacillus sp.]|nr:MAG: hypothetical protein DF221_10085 [Brevibacillus sp.]
MTTDAKRKSPMIFFMYISPFYTILIRNYYKNIPTITSYTKKIHLFLNFVNSHFYILSLSKNA